MSTELLSALDALAPSRVLLGAGAPELLIEVAGWVAAHSDVVAERGTMSAGPRSLVVTDDADAAATALGEGAAVLVSGDRIPDVSDETHVRLALSNGLALITPVGAATATTPGTATAGVPPVSVIVPIHNAAAELERCLRALARNTTCPAELVLIDDASTDPAVARVLADVREGDAPVRLLRNSVNLGFTATVNRGLRATRGDVVVLNSDTEVGPRWLERLRDAALRSPDTGSATACSDNAGAFAVPVIGEPNPLPPSLAVDDAARLVAQLAGDALTPTPTANGFCMYLRRAMLDDVGLLDERAFPRGYGEENDLSMRAGARGWRHVVDPGTFVHHVREASFGTDKAALARTGRRVLDARHPSYTAAVREFVADPVMAAARARIAAGWAAAQRPLPRVLFVIQEGGGGTPLSNFELMAGLHGQVDCLLFTSDRARLRLDRVVGTERIPLDSWELERPIRVLDFTREDYRQVIQRVLRRYAVELMHVRHLFKHTFDAPLAAAGLGIPVVFSFHDFYCVCPTVNLLDDHDHYCAGTCTPGFGDCRIPSAGLEGLPPLKHRFVHQWQEEVGAMLRGVDAFITTSQHAREVHRHALPVTAARPFEVIPHGRSLSQRHGFAEAPQPGGPVKIAVTGNLDVHKGGEYLREVKAADASGRLELHFFGNTPTRYADLGVDHGRFAAGALPAMIGALRPAMIGLFSICAETFSHALTEAWALGVPVVATDLGAFGERLREHGGGWLVPVDDPAEVVRRVLAVADDPRAYAAELARADLRRTPTVAEMTDGYLAVYREVLDRRRSLAPTPSPRRASERPRPGARLIARGTARVTAIVPGARGVFPGSTYVRVVQPLRHPRAAERLPSRIQYADHIAIPSDAQVALVQRTAVPENRVAHLQAELSARRLPMVLDLDDHLLLKGEHDLDYGAHQRSLRELLAVAAMTTVSTPHLERVIRQYTSRVALTPNHLDEHLFLSGLHAPPRAQESDPARVRLVYIGSATHADDLALLKPVMERLAAQAPNRFSLDVVGVQHPDADGDWFRRVPIPVDSRAYPRFVAWLRTQRPVWDIAVAPLADTEFNAFKSDLKWLECTGLGLPFVASRSEPYSSVTDHVTGRLVANDPDEWVVALRALGDDPGLAAGLAQAAWDHVTAHRLLRHSADRLADLLLSVA